MKKERWTYRPRSSRQGLLNLLGSVQVLLACVMLTACSEDKEEGEKLHVTFEARSCNTAYVEVSKTDPSGAATRAGEWDPSPYVPYSAIYGSNGMFKDQKNLVNKSIGIFFTRDNQSSLEGTLFFRESDQTWRLSMDIEVAGIYYLYGLIPREDYTQASITPNDSYSNGAVLNIEGLSAVTPSDVCVVIGAKDGTDSEHVTDLQAGNFAVNTNAAVQGSQNVGNNFIFLLFDHIYSALRFNFTVDEHYAALRTIRLRKLELIAYSSEDGAGVRSKYNATITLQKNDNGGSPIVGKVIFVPDENSAFVAPVPLFDWKDDPTKYVTLTTSAPAEFMGTFVPGDKVYFKLRSTYDVYDNNTTTEHPLGNLVRENCQAENTIDLRDKFGSYLSTTRGHCYSYTIKVQPTYLYVLSEPDMDNPTMVLTN